MDEKKKLQKKLVQMEEDYQHNKRQIEAGLAEVAAEQRQFLYYLEEVEEKIRYTEHKSESEAHQEVSIAYRIMEQAQDEGQVITKKAKEQIEEQLEANYETYKKQQADYEEKLQLLNKEEEK